MNAAADVLEKSFATPGSVAPAAAPAQLSPAAGIPQRPLLDRRVARLVVLVALLCAGAVALQLHGSSVAVWKPVLGDNSSPSGLLFSSAKAVRTDEWLAWTPAVLAQALHDPPFPVENANLGAGKTPLLMNVPVRHPSALFRPQLWGFFVFNVETAYSFYWCVKAAGLFLSFFFLLRALTGGAFWLPVFGAGWLWFSGYTQWWFSCPPMLPEMLSCWAIAIVCVMALFGPQRPLFRALAVGGLVVAGVNFSLCFYPAFQVPLVHLGAVLLAGWFWQNRGAALQWRAGGWCLGVAAVALAAVLVPYVIECKPTLELVASTKYPGERRSQGGTLDARDTFNGVLGFLNAREDQFLATRGNPCEGSNFYPLWALALAAGGMSLWRNRRAHRVELLLAGAVGVLTLYTFVPFPEWLCRATLLQFVTSERALLPIGVGGIILTTLLLARQPLPANRRTRVALAIAAVGPAVAVLASSNPGADPFLSGWRIAALLGLNALFAGLYLFAQQRIFCGFFLAALVLNNASVNPVVTGLGPLLDSDAGAVVREIRRQDPAAKWAAFTSAAGAQFVKAQGADVINGLHYVPQVELWRELDPAGKHEHIYNRYGFAVFTAGAGTREFWLVPPVTFGVNLSPRDPLLTSRNVRYFVFSTGVERAEELGLHFIARPARDFWIYQVAGSR